VAAQLAVDEAGERRPPVLIIDQFEEISQRIAIAGRTREASLNSWPRR
jgi:hypothetical protein